MSNKLLDYLVKEASAGEIARGMVSPAWMESHIAKKHGKSTGRTLGQALDAHVDGSNKMVKDYSIRKVLGTVAAGAAAGAAIAKASKGHVGVGAVAGSVLGNIAATTSSNIKSLSNQAKGMHKKYSDEKRAAFNALVEQGFDFDKAVDMVKQASLIGAARAGLYTLKRGVMKDAGQVKSTVSRVAGIASKKGITSGATRTAAIGSAKKLAGNRLVQVGAAGTAGYIAGKS